MPVSVVFVIFLLVVLITAFFILLPQARNNVRNIPEVITTGSPESQAETIRTQPPPDRIPEAQEAQTDSSSPGDDPLQDTEQEPAAPPQDREQEPSAALPEVEEVSTVDRGIYFMQAASDGSLVPARVSRVLVISNTPLEDSLNALLAGTTREERNRGLMNFIPAGTRIISVEMRGTTAVINFNDEFQFGTDGREGYDAQIEQIISTAKEFPTVHDVELRVRGIQVDVYGHGH